MDTNKSFSKEDKIKLLLLAAVLDALLIGILVFQKLEHIFDVVYILVNLIIHVWFFIAVSQVYRRQINILHIILVISLFLGFFTTNLYLQIVVLFLLLLIQVLWVLEERCILNLDQDGNFFQYDKSVSIIMILYFMIFSLKVGRKIGRKVGRKVGRKFVKTRHLGRG